jgi:tRNA nucleotidyltransferase (CCA-adding enzyme)
MKIYRVGGAVRDRLLGLPPAEHDWVVVDATEEEMRQRGFRQEVGGFPVFRHPETNEEYALARTETKTGPGYTGFRVAAGPGITLEQDLRRRDLTINALAEDEAGNLIDPFGGRADLEQGVLRHITPAFVEDPVRVLRVARFAARLDFHVAPETAELLRQMAASDDLRELRPERVWRELERALRERYPWRFFQVLEECGALQVLLPELAATPRDGLKRATGLTPDPAVRFAALLGAALGEGGSSGELCRRWRVPGDYCELLEWVLQYGPLFRAAADGEAEAILQLLHAIRAQQQPERLVRFELACSALWPQRAEPARAHLELGRRAVRSVSGAELSAAGLQGVALGQELERRQLAALRSMLAGNRTDS